MMKKTLSHLDKLKKVVEILPILLGFLIFCGFLKLYLYYNCYDVKIIDYLDLSEILLSFLNDLNIFLFIALIAFIYLLLSLQLFSYAERKIQESNTTQVQISVMPEEEATVPVVKPHESLTDIIGEGVENNKGKTILILFLATLIFVGLFFWTYNRVWLFCFSLAIFQFAAFILEYYTDFTTFIKVAGSFCVTFVGFTALIAAYDHYEIEHSAKTTTHVITLEDSILTTDSNYLLIGKSQNFIFLHDKSEHRTDIIKMETVKSISSKDNK